MDELICNICGNTINNKTHIVKEMMFGLRDEFTYLECINCGCLQLKNAPHDFSKYYPKEQYYSFNSNSSGLIKRKVKKYLLKKLLQFYLGQDSIIGKILSFNYEYTRKYAWVHFFKNINLHSKILDIGSGSGKYLLELYDAGFKNITGIDPYNQSIIELNKDITIFNYEISEVKDKYDFILMNHSLEHIPNQDYLFSELKRVTNIDGKILIRIPITGGEAWKNYGVNWYQIDAPRHFFIHSLKSFKILAIKHGFTIETIEFDSNDYQFKFSEQYCQNLTLLEDGNFPRAFYQKWRKQATIFNQNQTGDQVSIIIKY